MPQTLNPIDFIREHLIDPEMCTRCNTCEETCSVGAISNDSRNYVVDPDICNGCLDCIGPCPTGAINNWRVVARTQAYSTAEQFTWDVLPEQAALPAELIAAVTSGAAAEAPAGHVAVMPRAPASAARPQLNLFGHKAPAVATVSANRRLTAVDADSDIRHIVLNFGATGFPLLEGQTLGILPPGSDAEGKPHFMRAYSIASSRDGETPGALDVALTVKRVTEDHAGLAVRGVASNFLCDLGIGDSVQVVGPMGESFLMPDDPATTLVMICTGTGIAPMRAMIERRRRVGQTGRLVLFYGGRTPQEIPYHDELTALSGGLLDLHMAYSRVPGQPRQYVQDRIRAQHGLVAGLLQEANSYFYLCGLKGMEAGIDAALTQICADIANPWMEMKPALIGAGRLHIELY